VRIEGTGLGLAIAQLIIEDKLSIVELELDYFEINDFTAEIETRDDSRIERVKNEDYDLVTCNVYLAYPQKKIESDPSNPQYIETIWGVGYRLRA
jgi:DNA-binding response OmpR family regulator